MERVYAYSCCSISIRKSLSRFLTQLVVSPTWPATSSVESPHVSGKARCVTVHAASGESCVQSMEAGIVERDELRPWAFVDAVFELPPCPEAAPLPVDETEPEPRVGEGREVERAGPVAVGERPALLDEPDVQLFPVLGGEMEPAALDDAPVPLQSRFRLSSCSVPRESAVGTLVFGARYSPPVSRRGRIGGSVWGWVKKAAKKVANAVKTAAGVVWHFVRGVFSSLVQSIKWLVNTVLGLGEFVLILAGWMPWKTVRVQAVILLNEKRIPVAKREDVQKAVDLAATAFADEMHVRLEQPLGHVVLLPEAAPKEALYVGCDAAIWGAQFTGVGAWFRSRQVRRPAGTLLGYGEPVTVFVVQDVRNKAGCTPPGFLADYCVIDPDALVLPEGMLLTLAHEVGHACNYPDHWRADATLMQGPGIGRPRHLKRWQKALFRGSPHVTYW
jgi:hypothetical protein